MQYAGGIHMQCTLTLPSTPRSRSANVSAPMSRCPSAPAVDRNGNGNNDKPVEEWVHLVHRFFVLQTHLRVRMDIHQIVLVAHHNQTEVTMAEALQDLIAHRSAILRM